MRVFCTSFAVDSSGRPSIQYRPMHVVATADCVETISPVHLRSDLNIEKMNPGNSNMHNSELLPYHGLGSGLLRVCPHIELIDDCVGNLFKSNFALHQEQVA